MQLTKLELAKAATLQSIRRKSLPSIMPRGPRGQVKKTSRTMNKKELEK
jgi:hypothetical protein